MEVFRMLFPAESVRGRAIIKNDRRGVGSRRGRLSLAVLMATCLVACAGFAACAGGGSPKNDGAKKGDTSAGRAAARERGPGKQAEAQQAIKVGLVLDKGGKDDKSFNTAAWTGASQAAAEGGVELKDVETMDDALFEPSLRSFAERGFDLVIGIGFAQKEPLERTAAAFPDIHFAIVDAKIDLPNVASLLFDEHAGSFLVGAIAAASTRTGTVGFVGGMDIPLIRRFEMGYEAGAKHVNPDIRLLSNFVGVTSDAWNNPTRGKELGHGQYSRGADIIFAAAGASGLGVFDAAEEMKKLVIGVDSNQNWIKPGFVLTSMLKRVDQAVHDVIREAAAGRFQAGVRVFGLANSGIGYAIDEHNQAVLSPRVRSLADSLMREIVAGRIQVPDYYQKRSSG
jgi:basic membrane protein A